MPAVSAADKVLDCLSCLRTMSPRPMADIAPYKTFIVSGERRTFTCTSSMLVVGPYRSSPSLWFWKYYLLCCRVLWIMTKYDVAYLQFMHCEIVFSLFHSAAHCMKSAVCTLSCVCAVLSAAETLLAFDHEGMQMLKNWIIYLLILVNFFIWLCLGQGYNFISPFLRWKSPLASHGSGSARHQMETVVEWGKSKRRLM
jgi:hypothetical protein